MSASLVSVRRSTALALTIVAVAMTAGCSATGSTVTLDSVTAVYQDAVARGFHEAAALLEDGQVTADEVATAYEQVQSCYASKGLTSEFQGINPLDGWRSQFFVSWDGTGLTEKDGFNAYWSCVERYELPVVTAYGLTHDDVTDAAVMAAIVGCMQDVGLSAPTAAKNLRALAPLGQSDPLYDAVFACVGVATKDLTVTSVPL